MSVQIERRLFSVSDFYKMLDVGIFTEDDRVELLDGEIITMSPIDAKHAAIVDRLVRVLIQYLDDRAIVRSQNPVQLNDYSEPLPDIAILKWDDDFYTDHHPLPADTLLMIEVANTSLAYDRKKKLPRYARAGIPEVWIVNIEKQVVEQYSSPTEDEYILRRNVKYGEIVKSKSVPKLELPTEVIFGRRHA